LRRHAPPAQGTRQFRRRHAQVDREDTHGHLCTPASAVRGQNHAHARQWAQGLRQGDRDRHGRPTERAEAVRRPRRRSSDQRDDFRAFLAAALGRDHRSGPTGLELAQALARLGVETAVFEQSGHLAALRDADVTKELRPVLGKEFPIHLGVKLDVEKEGASLSWSGASTGAASFERILVAAGRPPALDDLNLAATGVATNERGVPNFDPNTLQCGDAPIFLAGDVDAQRPVLHEAALEGAIAGRNAASFPNVSKNKRAVPLSIMFTDPPLATVGSPPSDATLVGSASYADQGRARIEARNAGLVRIYADHNGVLTGSALFAPGMDHIAHLFAWAIERDETAAAVLALPFYHPTFEEGLKPALRQICEAVHTPELEHLDDVAPPGPDREPSCSPEFIEILLRIPDLLGIARQRADQSLIDAFTAMCLRFVSTTRRMASSGRLSRVPCRILSSAIQSRRSGPSLPSVAFRTSGSARRP
jgi:hypothetical protein